MMWSISRQHTFKALCLVSLLAACSDDPKDPKQTPVTIDDGVDMSVDQDAQTTEDMNDEPDFVRQEVEPNDSPSTATPLKLGEYFSGTISESTQSAWDVDFFNIEGERNTFLTIDLDKVGPGFDADGKKGLLVSLKSPDDSVLWLQIVQTNAKRTIYLPYTGTYKMSIQQLETKLDMSNPPHGGADYTYRGLITTAHAEPTEPPLALDTLIQGDLKDGHPDLFEVEISEASQFLLFARAQNNAAAQEKPLVYASIWSADAEGPNDSSKRLEVQWLKEQEDYDGSYVNIAPVMLQPGRYRILMDMQHNAKTPDYALMLRKVDGDDLSPRELLADQPYTTTIATPFLYRDDVDADLFKITLAPKTQAHIALTTPAQSLLKPRVFISDTAQRPQPSAVQSTGTLDFEVVNSMDIPQTYLLQFNHDPNLVVQDGERGVGGVAYTYTLTRKDKALEGFKFNYKNVVFNVPFDLPKYIWLEPATTSPDELWALSAFSTVDFTVLANDLASYVYGYTSDQSLNSTIAGFGGLPQPLLLGIRPTAWRMPTPLPAVAHYLSLDLAGVTYTEDPQLMPGLTRQAAPLVALDTPISASFKLAGESHFYKVALAEGEGLAIITDRSTAPGAVDVPTEIIITDETSTPLRAQSGIISTLSKDRVTTSTFGLQNYLYSSYAALPYYSDRAETVTIEIIGRYVGAVQGSGDYTIKLARVAMPPMPPAP